MTSFPQKDVEEKVEIVEAVPVGLTEDDTEDDADLSQSVPVALERNYRGIKSDFDYRKWTIER